MDVEVTGLRELIADLDKATSRALPETEKVVTKGALNIKQDWARRWSGHAHAPALPAAINYDVYTMPGSIRAEIGPDKGRPAGALGNIYEFGTPRSAPMPGGLPALEAEAPKMEQALGDLSEKLLGD